MNITVTIDSVDRTSLIEWSSFRIDDVKDYHPNTCTFRIKKHSGQTYVPSLGDEVEVTDGAEKIFAGKIIRLQTKSESKIIYYDIMVKDWTLLLDKIHVTDRFSGQTIGEVIDDIVTDYLTGDGVTTNNVSAPIDVDTVSFQDLSVSKCLQKLAEQINYHWYIDYDKDIHFFPKHTENAPFELDGTTGNYVKDTLTIENDLSQLRNRVVVRGAEVESETERTKIHTGDGTQTTFDTSYKFSSLPTVEVNSVAQTVGVENLEEETGNDCMWDYNQKYIRFITAPSDGDTIEITQKYLYPLYVQVQDDNSIEEFGLYEFKKTDKTIKSAGEARQIGTAELEAYANGITDARFRTRESGLMSGQTIHVGVSDLGIDEDYMIQRTSLRLEGPDAGIWDVELASLRTIGIIDVLQSLLVNSEKNIEFDEDAVLEKNFVDYQTIQVTEEISLKIPTNDHQDIEVTEEVEKDPFGGNVEPIFVVGPYTPSGNDDPYREGRVGVSMYVHDGTEGQISQTVGSSIITLSTNGYPYKGQTFLMPEKCFITSIVVQLFRGSPVTGDIYMDVYQTDGTVPIGDPIFTSDPLDASTITGTPAEYEFDVETGILDAEKYAFVLRGDGLSAFVAFYGYNGSNPYTDGGFTYKISEVASWGVTSPDLYFKVNYKQK